MPSWLVRVEETACRPTQMNVQVPAEFRIMGWSEQGFVKDFKALKLKLGLLSSRLKNEILLAKTYIE